MLRLYNALLTASSLRPLKFPYLTPLAPRSINGSRHPNGGLAVIEDCCLHPSFAQCILRKLFSGCLRRLCREFSNDSQKTVQPDGCTVLGEDDWFRFLFLQPKFLSYFRYEKEEVSKFSLDAPDVPVHGPQQFTGVMKLFSFLRG